jgi:hypothetical protein
LPVLSIPYQDLVKIFSHERVWNPHLSCFCEIVKSDFKFTKMWGELVLKSYSERLGANIHYVNLLSGQIYLRPRIRR